MFKTLKEKRKFTLIELVIVIVVIGILAGMAIPKFIGVSKDAKVAAMIRDIETLEKTIAMEQIKKDTLPLYSPEEVVNHTSNNSQNSLLEKLVFAEDKTSLDTMEGMYGSFKEVLDYNGDLEEYLYKINLDLLEGTHSKLKFGDNSKEGDFYVYSALTGSVYYYDYLFNSQGTVQHSRIPKVTFDDGIITKNKSLPIENITTIDESTLPIGGEVVLTTPDWSNGRITKDTPLAFTYNLTKGKEENIKQIEWKVNGVVVSDPNKRYDVAGNYTIEMRIQNNKGVWGPTSTLDFVVEDALIGFVARIVMKNETNPNNIIPANYDKLNFSYEILNGNPTDVANIIVTRTNGGPYGSMSNLNVTYGIGTHSVGVEFYNKNGVSLGKANHTFTVEAKHPVLVAQVIMKNLTNPENTEKVSSSDSLNFSYEILNGTTSDLSGITIRQTDGGPYGSFSYVNGTFRKGDRFVSVQLTNKDGISGPVAYYRFTVE